MAKAAKRANARYSGLVEIVKASRTGNNLNLGIITAHRVRRIKMKDGEKLFNR
jgi:hypothetical protein